MYDIFRYIFKNNKLNSMFYMMHDELMKELNNDKLSSSFYSNMQYIHVVQSKNKNVAEGLIDYLSQDQKILNRKRKIQFYINILINMVPAFLATNYIGVYQVISIVFAIAIFIANIVADVLLSAIIYSKENVIKKLHEGIMLKKDELEKLVNKYVDFVSKENNITCCMELSFNDDKNEDIKNKDNNEYVFSTDNDQKEISESKLTSNKPKVKKRIRRDGDK